jgi:hypothetical protein
VSRSGQLPEEPEEPIFCPACGSRQYLRHLGGCENWQIPIERGEVSRPAEPDRNCAFVKDIEDFIRESRAAGEPQITCGACGTPWEGVKNNHGTTRFECVEGYVYQVGGGHHPEPDICPVCGVADCAPDCFHYQKAGAQ